MPPSNGGASNTQHRETQKIKNKLKTGLAKLLGLLILAAYEINTDRQKIQAVRFMWQVIQRLR